jgi:plasmid maintenance system antidote protein VapI
MKASKIIANSDEIIRKMLRDYLQKNGLSLNAFCLDAKLHQSNIHTFLNGKSLTSKTIQRLAKYLNEKGM